MFLSEQPKLTVRVNTEGNWCFIHLRTSERHLEHVPPMGVKELGVFYLSTSSGQWLKVAELRNVHSLVLLISGPLEFKESLKAEIFRCLSWLSKAPLQDLRQWERSPVLRATLPFLS